MNFRKIWLSFLITINVLIIILFIYFATFDEDMRLVGGILTCVFTMVSWLIVMTILFKSEAPAKKVNMSNRYTDMTSLELEKFGIDSEKYKCIIFEKFKLIHDAFSNLELDVLKSNVTLDLYNYFLEQLEVYKALNRKSIMKDIELVNIKIYEVDNFRIKAYVNVKMYDYQIDLDTLKCVYGSDKEKRDLEFEIYFENKGEINGLYDQYVMSKKYCINDMDNKK